MSIHECCWNYKRERVNTEQGQKPTLSICLYNLYFTLYFFGSLCYENGTYMGVKFTDFPGESLIVKCGPRTYLWVGEEGNWQLG